MDRGVHRVNRRQANRWAQQDAQYYQQPSYQQPPPVVQPATPPAPDPIAQLKDLADLKAQGILTDEEFAAQKARILAA